jgi:hypothetical protein
MKPPEVQGSGWRDEVGSAAIDDCRDQVQCLDDRALPRIILSDDDSVGLEGHRVVTKAPVVLQTESAQHSKDSLQCAGGPRWRDLLIMRLANIYMVLPARPQTGALDDVLHQQFGGKRRDNR